MNLFFGKNRMRTIVRTLLHLLLLLSTIASAQEFGAVRYLGHYIPPSGGAYTSGCWGWTDTTTGREYALLGNDCGTAVVEITNAAAPIERDFVPGVCSSWRELQVYDHYAYVVSEGGGGTQIIDLSYLPDSVHLVKSFIFSQGANNTPRSHSLHIKDGYMYLNGCATWAVGGIVIFSLADPVNPQFKSVYSRIYVHDCFVRHDTIYAAGINGQGADIINITNKTSPQYLYTVTYPGSGTHNTATADGRYLFTTDEIGATAKTLKVWDLSAPPVFPKVAEYVGSPTAIVHNAFIRDSMVIMSYYTAGMRVVNISDPTNPLEIGGYDSYPSNDDPGYTGAWSVYPFFPSGKIIVGDMVTGMYIVDINVNGPLKPSPFSAYSDFSTPTSVTLSWNDPTQFVSGAPLTNFKLHIYRNNTIIASVDSGVETYTDLGRTKHQQYTYTIRAVTPSESSSVATSQAYAGGAAQSSAPGGFQALDAIGGTELRWINPSTQIDGAPLNDLAAIEIYRDGILFDNVPQTSADTGQARTYLDPVFAFHQYSIRVRDSETPTYYSAQTSVIGSMGGAYTTYVESFDSSLSSMLRTGAWDTTSALSASGGHALTDSPVGNYSSSTSSSVIFPSVILGVHPMLQISHIAIIAFGDFGFLEISKNHRASFSTIRIFTQALHPQWQDGVASPGDWVTDRIDLTAYAGDTVNVRFRLVTNSSLNADGWYVDDVYLGPADGVVSSSYNVNANWNLVSLPVQVADARTTAVYPSAVSPSYRYSGGYSTDDTLDAGAGYWLKFPAGASVPISGSPVRRDTVNLLPGWNLIGSVSTSIDTSVLKTIPSGRLASPLFGYSGGYAIVPTVEPGKAYWVKAAASCKLVLNSFLNKVPAQTAHDPAERPSRLEFTDADGQHQTLYAGMALTAEFLASSELPPLPPEGAFDIRFASQRSAEILPGSGTLPIQFQSVRYPLSARWDSPSGERIALRVDGRELPLSPGSEVALLRPPLLAELVASGPSQTPAAYALYQNYPNPFNPRTDLRYDLPEAGFVTLKIYDLLGRVVSTLVLESRSAGHYSTAWNADSAPSGIYYARLTATSPTGEILFQSTKKLVLSK